MAVSSSPARIVIALTCCLAMTWFLTPPGSRQVDPGTAERAPAVRSGPAQDVPTRSEVSRSETTPRRVWASKRWTKRHCRSGRIALTFDDGPSATVTPGLLEYLTAKQVPATFFVVGSRLEGAPRAARAIAGNKKLFTIGNHTWAHPDLRGLTPHQVRRSLRGTAQALRSLGIRPSRLMRPPYGALNPSVRATIRSLRLVPVLWNVDSEDWRGGTANQIADRILAQLRRGQRHVVLQHDGVNNSPNSVAAVPRVVRSARARGYCFVPLNRHGHAGRPLNPFR